MPLLLRHSGWHSGSPPVIGMVSWEVSAQSHSSDSGYLICQSSHSAIHVVVSIAYSYPVIHSQVTSSLPLYSKAVQWGAHKNPDGLAETGMISSVFYSH